MTAEAMSTRMVTVKEAAKILSCSIWYIRAMKRAGAPVYRKFFLDELITWRKAHPEFNSKAVWRKPEGEIEPS